VFLAAQLAGPALDAVHAEEEVDDPAHEGHEQDEADPASRRALIRLGQNHVDGRAAHAPELDEREHEGPDIPESRFHRSPD
jgi:hypothetical protein